MSAYVVPQLLGKLNLLIHNGRYENLGAIADKFGITEDAVRFWTKQTDGQLAGTVPAKRVKKLQQLFAEVLPNQTEEDIDVLLQGPLLELEDALRRIGVQTLTQILQARADDTAGRLIPVEAAGMGLVVANRLSAKAHCKFPLGQTFRLEFSTQHRGRYLLGVQRSSQAWGCVDVDWAANRKTVHMPGRTDSGDLGSLDESADDGVSAFYVIQSARAFPSIFAKILLDAVPLGRTELSLLAEFLQGTPETEVHVMRFDVEFIDPINASR